MDKNIKAELFSLRNEVLTNMKNIETVVSKIDSKLQEEDNVSCLSRCPEIESLLQKCRQVQWHPDTKQQEIDKFMNLVNHIDEIMSTIQAEKYADQVADLVKLINRMDVIKGPVGGLTENEKYWEKINPGTTNLQLAHMYRNLKTPEVPPESIQEAKQLLEQKLSEKEQSEPDLSHAPAWAKNVDNKSIDQIIKDAMVWDEMNQQIFVNMWNSMFAKRLEVLNECLETAALDILNTKPPKHLNVTSMEDAQKALELFQKFEEIKQRMVVSLREFTSNCKTTVDAANDDQKFVKYYEYLSNYVSSIPDEKSWFTDIAIDNGIFQDLSRRFTSLVNAAIQDHEMNIYEEPLIFTKDDTFELKQLSNEQIAMFKKNGYDNYTKDLKNAYEFIAKQTATSAA